MKSLFFFMSILLTGCAILTAAWDPDYILATNKTQNNQTLIELEQKVVHFLQNSWCSEAKAKLLLELIINTQPNVSVEIGACTGSSTVPMLAALQYLGKGHAYIIEAWSNEEAVRGLPKDDPNAAWWATVDMQAIKNHFTHTMTHWNFDSYIQVLHMTSALAIDKLQSIDFLHLDGNVSEEGAFLDSQVYLPKVVSGGYILLSNALVMIGGKPTKMKALWPLFEHCDLVCEIENGNVLLFKKK